MKQQLLFSDIQEVPGFCGAMFLVGLTVGPRVAKENTGPGMEQMFDWCWDEEVLNPKYDPHSKDNCYKVLPFGELLGHNDVDTVELWDMIRSGMKLWATDRVGGLAYAYLRRSPKWRTLSTFKNPNSGNVVGLFERDIA